MLTPWNANHRLEKLEEDRAKERAEWWGWRGAMGTQVDALAGELRTTLQRNEINFNRRMDKQDEAIEKILEQGKITNGRVTELENVRRVDVEVRRDGRRMVLAQADRARFRVTTVVALVSGAAGAATGFLLHFIH